jgi:hypothetical protein
MSALAGAVLVVGGAGLAVLVALGDRRRWLPPAVLGLTVLSLYLRTMSSSVGQADTFEFQVVVPQLGVAHPTGYPLYILLGKLFTLLPWGSMAWRVNLASAVFATAGVLVLYALVLRLTGPCSVKGSEAAPPYSSTRWLPALVASLAFALSSTFWSQAIVAEVYALHNLLVAAMLWLLFGPRPHPQSPTLPYSDAPVPPCPSTFTSFWRPSRRWQAVFLLIGLSFTNHLTTMLLLPPVALALLWDRPRMRLKGWLITGGLLLLGLSVYLFIPLRWPALNRGDWMTLREFFAYVTGSQFHGALRLDGWRDLVRWGILGRMLYRPFGWAGLGLAAVGAVELAIRWRRELVLTGVTFLSFGLYGLVYYVPDISVFLLPAHLILAVWIGVGGAALIDLTCDFLSLPLPARSSSFVLHRLPSIIAHCSLFFLLPLLSLSRIWLNFPLVDQSQDRGVYAWGQYALSMPLASGGAVLADVEKFAPLYYLQQVERVRPDLDLVLLGSEQLYQAELAGRLAAGQTVYLARYLPDLSGLYLRSVGPLVEARDSIPVAGRLPEGAGVSFGKAIHLLDGQVRADPLGRALYHVTLSWWAETPVAKDLLIRLRLVDAGGRVCWESDGARPVGGLYPTNAWPADVTITDYHELLLPPWLPQGEYVLEVGLFPPFSDAGLAVDSRVTPWLALDTVEVSSPSAPLPPLPYAQLCFFNGGAWLTGYNAAAEVPAGAPFTVDLSWRAVDSDGAVRLAWIDAPGRRVGTATFPLARDALRSRLRITAPRYPGVYTLSVGLEREAVRCAWMAAPTDICPLVDVQVVAAQEGLANFDDQMLLLDADVSVLDPASTIRPGEALRVALRWQALRTMDQDYTVFVHLIGPDGRLYGQVDMWPVQGSYPTGQWTVGEEVVDPYEVRLDSNAPPGDYRVEVGWYLLATMQRLQVVDVMGNPVSDSIVVGEFSVVD